MSAGGAALPLPSIRSKNLATAAAIIKVANSQLGYREGYNNDTAYGRWYGVNHQPWCAIFISWLAAKSGNTANIPKFAYTPAGADWFKSKGLAGKTPKKGAIHFVYHESMGRIAHVELVVSVDTKAGTYTVIGGNTSNTSSRNGDGVYKLVKRISNINPKDVFGYPSYDPYEA